MTQRSRRLRRFTLAALAASLVVLGAAACASTGAASSGPRPDEVSMAELWHSLQADLMDGRSHSAEARARELLALQDARCRQMRSELVADSGTGTSSAIDTSALARCEDELREYRTLARLSDLSYGGR